MCKKHIKLDQYTRMYKNWNKILEMVFGRQPKNLKEGKLYESGY